jgi:magnesium transporter
MFTRSLYGTPDLAEQGTILAAIATLADTGRLRSTLTSLLGPIDAANLRQAHAQLETGSTIGKLVVSNENRTRRTPMPGSSRKRSNQVGAHKRKVRGESIAQTIRRASGKAGMAPGTMVFIGEQKLARPRIEIFDFNAETARELPDVGLQDCFDLNIDESSVVWINVNGVHDIGVIQAIGEHFGLHPMTLEDLVNTAQRPKLEDFPHYLFIVLKMMEFSEASQTIATEHVSMILASNYLLTFLEDEGDVFDSVRERLRTAKGRVRLMKADYLAFSLMDAIVDHYFLAIERVGDRIEEIDDRILEDPQKDDMNEIHHLKRGILGLRKAAWPCREVLGAIEKSESTILRPATKVFWRDLYDHSIQVIDMVETYRDILGSMHDTYLSSISNRMNEVMKTLTIISSIFIPLTFIAGVYGMNFENMPELKWPLGYHATLAVMLLIGLVLVGYFKRRKWL